MSWLVAVCFPGLLMFGTVALQRLETLLQGDRPTAAEIVARIEQRARTAREAAREAARERTAPLPLRNVAFSAPRLESVASLAEEPGLPTRLCARAQSNP